MERTAILLVLVLSACSSGNEPSSGPAESSSQPAAESTAAGEPLPPAPAAAGRLATPPDIVLITLDTLRREHLGCYGYFRDTSPHIDAVAREGLLFERALASMASTLPSHLTMLTGLYAHQHGVDSNLRGATAPFASAPGRRSVAEVLRENGYRTAAFVSAAPLQGSTGIDVGFDTYRSATSQRRAADTNELVLKWLAKNAPSREPIFLWVHYFDAHEPYDPPAPYKRRFETDERLREWIRARGIDPAALERRYPDPESVRPQFLSADHRSSRPEPGMLEFTPESLENLINRHDGELRYMDEHVGKLLDALRRHGRYDGAILVLVGDHGQSLGENAWLGHGSITNVNTFVPLIVRFPPGVAPQPARIDALVSLADLMPTVLARFEFPGATALREQFEGADVLSGAFRRPHALVERSMDLAEGDEGHQFALVSGRWKLVHRPQGTDELYDLAGAGEFVDVASAHPDVAARLRTETLALLERKRAAPADRPAGQANTELLKQLEELGYGGGKGD